MQTFNGYKKAAEAVNMAIPPFWIQVDARDEESSYRCMQRILSMKPTPSAVFCTTDLLAIGAMKCAKETGYKVAGDISFIGVDDILLSRYVEPALTTVRIDKLEMGRLAMELLIRKINREPAEAVTVESDRIVERQSVAQK
jgi:DNA-binding LacI/PurR family transcriptional regulator